MADKIILVLDGDDYETIRQSLEFTCDSLSETHKKVVRSVDADTAKKLWDSAMEYINVKERITNQAKKDVTKEKNLAVALMDMMDAEGGEPGDSLAQQQAWKRAVQVLKDYGYE